MESVRRMPALFIAISLLFVACHGVTIPQWTKSGTTLPISIGDKSVCGHSANSNELFILSQTNLMSYDLSTKAVTTHAALPLSIDCLLSCHTQFNNYVYFLKSPGNIGRFNMNTHAIQYPLMGKNQTLNARGPEACLTVSKDGKRLFIVGGRSWCPEGCGGGDPIKSFQIYDIETDILVTGPGMVSSRLGLGPGCAVVDDLLYWFGGYKRYNGPTDTLQYIDISSTDNIAAQTWKGTGGSMNPERSYQQTVVFNGLVYNIGGSALLPGGTEGDQYDCDIVDAFYFTTGQSVTDTPLPAIMRTPCVTTTANEIYVINNAELWHGTPDTTRFPTRHPTISTRYPTTDPSIGPTRYPTISTHHPTKYPTRYPTTDPSISPTRYPTTDPSTGDPSISPTRYPTINPTTLMPTINPTPEPTGAEGRVRTVAVTGNTNQAPRDRIFDFRDPFADRNVMLAFISLIAVIVVWILALCVCGICWYKSKNEHHNNDVVNIAIPNEGIEGPGGIDGIEVNLAIGNDAEVPGGASDNPELGGIYGTDEQSSQNRIVGEQKDESDGDESDGDESDGDEELYAYEPNDATAVTQGAQGDTDSGKDAVCIHAQIEMVDGNTQSDEENVAAVTQEGQSDEDSGKDTVRMDTHVEMVGDTIVSEGNV